MTESDDEEPDSGADQSAYATVDEVAAELSRLSRSELQRMVLQAKTLIRGTDLEAKELINTVLERLLTRDGDRRRHWHRKETLAGCVYRTMKSIVRDHWRRLQIPMHAINDSAAGLQSEPNPEVQLVARQELLEVLRTLDDSENTAAIALELASGHSPGEVKKRFGLSDTDYDSALKRIRRRILRYKRLEVEDES
jgi:RNA polymerase sigma-70 factor (ECF subfamily)